MVALLLGWGCATDPIDPTEATEPLEPVVRDVVFATDTFDLEGTFAVPARSADERVPTVVLVHGSGPNSRDVPVQGQLNLAFGLSFDLFGELSDQLTAQGVAVLRYDKRTCIPANGCSNDYPPPSPDVIVDEFVTDAAAAVRYVAEQPEVDPDRLFVVGHSQGGSFVPLLLRDEDVLDGGVILAGPFRGIDGLLRFQLESSRDLLEELGTLQDSIDAQLASLEDLVAGVEAIAAGSFEGAAVGGVTVAFWESWLAIGDEAVEAALQVDAPILALGGDYDWNVPPEEIDAWGAHLAGSGVGHEATVLPCITHAMNCISQPDWRLVTPADIGRGVDASVTDALLDWIQ